MSSKLSIWLVPCRLTLTSNATSRRRISKAAEDIPQVIITVLGIRGRPIPTSRSLDGTGTPRRPWSRRLRRRPTPSSLEQVLFDVGLAREPQHAGVSGAIRERTVDGAFEHPTREDCDNASTSGPRLGGEQSRDVDDSSSVHPRSDGSTLDEQGGEQCSLSTPPTSMAGSEAGYDR